MNQQSWRNIFDFKLYEELDSTNNEAKRYIANPPSSSHTIICARKQTSGRGKYGNSWVSQEGNLFCSIIIPNTKELSEMSQLSFVTSCALEKTIGSIIKENNLEQKIELKWPNDVLLEGKKISGILLETTGSRSEYLIIGIGINLLYSPELPDILTTNLKSEGIKQLDYSVVIDKLITNFVEYYHNWLETGFLGIREYWLKKAYNLGKNTVIKLPNSIIKGKFIDIDLTGQMMIKLDTGQIKPISSGDVFFYE